MKGLKIKRSWIGGVWMEKIPEFDSRTREEWIEEIRKKATVYTPEWRFNQDLPDVGTTLALIYADIMADTIRRWNQVGQKNHIAFLERIGTCLKPAVAASGYITFQFMNQEMEGSPVLAGTHLIGETEDGGSTVFETMEDVYVTPATIQEIYLSVPSEDKISLLYQRTEETPFPCGISLFDRKRENLQRHRFYFSHSFVLQIKGAAWIIVNFQESKWKGREQDKIRFSYYSEQGYQEFEKQQVVDGQLMLYKGAEQPPFARLEFLEEQIEGYFIQGEILDGRFFSSYIGNSIRICSKGEALPELVYSNGTEQLVREFLPFGERPIPFTECYIVSEEVFGKKGAWIELDFELDFIRVPLENIQNSETEFNWKMVMKRSTVKEDPEYDICVGEVIWEYFNGEGFKRLFLDRQYEDLFTMEDGVLRRHSLVRFLCPSDIEAFPVSSATGCCIRIRVLKIYNFYKMKGNYIAPRIQFLKLRYEYQQNSIAPEYLLLENNLERVYYSGNQLCENSNPIILADCRKEPWMTMYMGFDRPLKNGPLRLLCSMGETLMEKLPYVDFEYFDGRHWRNLNIVDETECFRKTGLLTIIAPEHFTSLCLFGKDRYWIRILDYENLYQREEGQLSIPYLDGIYLNSTVIRGTETMEEELFYVLPNQENLVCHLNFGQIDKLEVWVNEKKRLHPKDWMELKKQRRIREVCDSSGTVQEIWVLWEETEQFFTKKEENDPKENNAKEHQKRSYQVDRIEGTVFFPNGRNGRIPPDGEMPTIRILYSVTEAEKGNLAEGKIHTLESDIGFISEVNNYEVTTGGLPQETEDLAMERSTAAIRHGGRAVTARDFEDLAKEATRNISKAKCFSNYNIEGKKQYGAVTLVLLQKDFEKGSKYFDKIREQVMNYLKPRMNEELYLRGLLQIIEPKFIKLNVTASVEVWEYQQVFGVRQEMERRLEEFLHPVTGNFNHTGFEIGVLPNKMQILNLLQGISNIKAIKNIRLTACRFDKGHMIDIDLEQEGKLHYMLARNGSHQIQIQAENQRR